MDAPPCIGECHEIHAKGKRGNMRKWNLNSESVRGWVSIVLSASVVVCTIAYVRYAARQADVMTSTLEESRKMAEETRKMAEETRRLVEYTRQQAEATNLSVDTYKAAAGTALRGDAPNLAVALGDMTNFSVRRRPTVTVDFNNRGKTPATNTYLVTYIQWRSSPVTDGNVPVPNPVTNGFVIAPGTSATQTVSTSSELSSADMKAIRNGRFLLYTYGAASYGDGIWRETHTEVLFQV